MRRLALVAVALLLTACTPQQAIDAIFPAERAVAHRIAQCESNYNPWAVSPTNDHGLFQINGTTWNKPGHADPVADYIGRNWHRRYDPVVNATMARKIRDAYGWRMWACF